MEVQLARVLPGEGALRRFRREGPSGCPAGPFLSNAPLQRSILWWQWKVNQWRTGSERIMFVPNATPNTSSLVLSIIALCHTPSQTQKAARLVHFANNWLHFGALAKNRSAPGRIDSFAAESEVSKRRSDAIGALTELCQGLAATPQPSTIGMTSTTMRWFGPPRM